MRATLIVMPFYVLALADPSFSLAAIMKTVALGQQVGENDARSAGRELVGATLIGAGLGLAVWMGVSLWPSLWMRVLWRMAAALWTGSALFGVHRTPFRPSFWSNALLTALILLGPAFEASGRSVLVGEPHAPASLSALRSGSMLTLRFMDPQKEGKFLSLIANRERYCEGCPIRINTFNGDSTFMHFDNSFDNGEPEARTASGC
jgi:hypothetical protein